VNSPAMAARRTGPRKVPTLRHERSMWRSRTGLLAAFDEVGRGALAGPVSVGVVLLAADTKPAPFGVADSKLLSPEARVRLVPRIKRWALDSAVGHASAAEIDAIGLMAALRTAAERAVSQLSRRPDWILLDGNHDYLTVRTEPTLFDEPVSAVSAAGQDGWRCEVPVVTIIKGDMKCSSIAAASVLAKTERDAMLVELAREHPEYGFEANKAYSTPFHLAALVRHGPSAVHRQSWNLPLTQVDAMTAGQPEELTAMAAAAGMDDDEQMDEEQVIPSEHRRERSDRGAERGRDERLREEPTVSSEHRRERSDRGAERGRDERLREEQVRS
jgi:ribonuclease HII